MKFDLSRFSLFSPDEILSYWFVSHDFAAALKLDESSEAAKVIKSACLTSGVKIDFEADAVTLRISRSSLVIPTLVTLYTLLGWSTEELDQIKSQVLAFKRPKPRALSVGDLFHIPITANLFGLGQIIDINHKAPTVAIFSCIGPSNEITPSAFASVKALTILHIVGDSLYKGDWPVIGSKPVSQDPASGPGGRLFSVGSKSYGGDGPIVNLLKAQAGLRSWSEGYNDPQYLMALVLS